MRLIALSAALALALAAASPAFAQTTAPAAESANGLAVADARAWLIGLGGSVAGPVAADGAQTLTVADPALPWTLTFYNCAGAGPCDDVQYSAVFSGQITLEQVNSWNRENRYLKAFYVPGATPAEGGAIAQYDVILTGTGAAPLQEPTGIWLQMLRQFAGYLAQAAAPSTAP